jgi:peptidoglycan/LPS O-acetylase OafA/YrhL
LALSENTFRRGIRASPVSLVKGIHTREHLESLDGVRGVSILLVLLSHTSIPGLEAAGGIGVDIFFVLSGFLITTILVREYDGRGSVSLTEFYKRRSLRLFPALLLMCLLFVAYSAVFSSDISKRLREVMEGLLYVTNWSTAFDLGHSHYLGHTWSLGIEEQFYLLWPVVLVGVLQLRRGHVIAFWVALMLAVAAATWRTGLAIDGARTWRLYSGFDTRCDAVLIGCALTFIAPRLALLWPLGAFGILVIIAALHFDYYIPTHGDVYGRRRIGRIVDCGCNRT